jgi:hypothetical protein
LRECPRTCINTGPYERLAEGEHSLLLKLGARVKRLRTSKGYTQMISSLIST